MEKNKYLKSFKCQGDFCTLFKDTDLLRMEDDYDRMVPVT